MTCLYTYKYTTTPGYDTAPELVVVVWIPLEGERPPVVCVASYCQLLLGSYTDVYFLYYT